MSIRLSKLLLLLIAIAVVVTRLAHSSVLWADDTLPLAAAMQVVRGKTLYRDVWFDKPPLVAWFNLLWGAHAGVLLRLAGAAYVLAAAAAAWQFARSKWSEREGILAAALTAFFLTFGLPSAIIPMASDMLLILPHLLAVFFAWRGRAFLSGVAAGVGLLCSSKALFVLLACALWQWRQTPALLAGFAAPNAIAIGWMWWYGSLGEFYKQVWQWGSIYAANTFVENPVVEGLKRTANWAGFHAALVVGAAIAIWRGGAGVLACEPAFSAKESRSGDRLAAKDGCPTLLLWIALGLVGVTLGLRFFPRYYFLLLPPLVIAAARGWSASRAWVLLAILLLPPLVRFAPAYFTLETSRDLAIDRDSREAAAKLRASAHPGETLFVWGFRPDIFIYSSLPAGTRFLESQPISGVLADRHLFSASPVAADFIAPNRRELMESRPTWVVDGLGLYNPRLALSNQAELAQWFQQYSEAGRTNFSILYRLR